MRHLYSADGEQALLEVMRLEPLIAFDFDGTLAPIVSRPEEARVSASNAEVLAELAKRRPVGIITGRSVADVEPRLGFKPHYVVGNHGAEDPSGALRPTDPHALDRFRLRIEAQHAALRAAGVHVEDKGHSLALHYRLADDHAVARASIALLLRGLDPTLSSFGGKCVVNVVPANAPDKADAVVSLLERSGSKSAVFVGDDINDETVFARAKPHWLTVRVGRDNPPSSAMFFLDTTSEVDLLLQKMLALLESPQG
jgi:trehalose 6-phosphate phosphatase